MAPTLYVPALSTPPVRPKNPNIRALPAARGLIDVADEIQSKQNNTDPVDYENLDKEL